jgi:predicted RNA polymerase sigma factor
MLGEVPEATMKIEIVPADTTLEAARVQFEVFRRMRPDRRLELALEMSTALRNVAASGVRSRHPDYSEEQVKLAVARLTLGDELFSRAYPGVDVQV